MTTRDYALQPLTEEEMRRYWQAQGFPDIPRVRPPLEPVTSPAVEPQPSPAYSPSPPPTPTGAPAAAPPGGGAGTPPWMPWTAQPWAPPAATRLPITATNPIDVEVQRRQALGPAESAREEFQRSVGGLPQPLRSGARITAATTGTLPPGLQLSPAESWGMLGLTGLDLASSFITGPGRFVAQRGPAALGGIVTRETLPAALQAAPSPAAASDLPPGLSLPKRPPPQVVVPEPTVPSLRLAPAEDLVIDVAPATPGLPRRPDYYEPRGFTHVVLDEQGNAVATVNLRLAEDLAEPGVTAQVSIEGDAVNQFGAGAVRNVMRQLTEAHPEIQRFVGPRVTGARGQLPLQSPRSVMAQIEVPPQAPVQGGMLGVPDRTIIAESPNVVQGNLDEMVKQQEWGQPAPAMSAEEAEQQLFQRQMELDVLEPSEGFVPKAPHFGTRERIEWETARRGTLNKAQRLRTARASVRRAEQSLFDAQTPGMRPVAGGMDLEVVPPEIERILRQTEEVVRQDEPGKFTRLGQRMPGLKQLMEFERPGLKMDLDTRRSVLIAHVAEGQARSDVATRAMSSRAPIQQELTAAFGEDAMRGGKVDVPFLGTPEEAASPITGTVKDIADNPHLYTLSPEQTEALNHFDGRNIELLEHIVQGYEAKIGQYPAKPGGAYLPNLRSSEDLLESMSNESAAIAKGGMGHRFYESARDRMTADPGFSPELNVVKLMDAMDMGKARAAGGLTFREAVGGKSLDEVMSATHPALFQKMTRLKKTLAGLRRWKGQLDEGVFQAVDDFLADPYAESLDELRDSMDVHIRAGRTTGEDRTAVAAAIDDVKAQIAGLRPAWKGARTFPYERVEEGLYRYYTPETANLIKEVRQRNTNPLTKFMEEIRGGSFSSDVSPIVGVQTPLGTLFDPVGQAKSGVGAIGRGIAERDPLRTFRTSALAEDIGADTPRWTQFFSLMGRAPAGTPDEMAAGWISRIPKVGKAVNQLTEGTFIAVTRQQFNMWKDMTKSLTDDGVPDLVAQVAAAGKVQEVFPLLQGTRLGQSPRRTGVIRALPTSYSFIRQPIALTAQATQGFIKLGTKQTLKPSEKLAVKLMLTFAASTASVSASSAVLSAEAKGRDKSQAAWDSINPSPSNARFLSIIVGDKRIPLGGPYRALIRGILSPVNYFRNRLNPVLGTSLELAQNQDFNRQKIMTGSQPEKVMRGIWYAVENALPLTLGAASEDVRTGTPGEIPEDVATQFLGTSPQTTYSQLDTLAIDKHGKRFMELEDYQRSELQAIARQDRRKSSPYQEDVDPLILANKNKWEAKANAPKTRAAQGYLQKGNDRADKLRSEILDEWYNDQAELRGAKGQAAQAAFGDEDDTDAMAGLDYTMLKDPAVYAQVQERLKAKLAEDPNQGALAEHYFIMDLARSLSDANSIPVYDTTKTVRGVKTTIGTGTREWAERYVQGGGVSGQPWTAEQREFVLRNTSLTKPPDAIFNLFSDSSKKNFAESEAARERHRQQR